jgi:hypothetical protein
MSSEKIEIEETELKIEDSLNFIKLLYKTLKYEEFESIKIVKNF